ncbi:MAG: hypothetical protein ACP5RI_02930 [Candidatus Micrarchaeia archaeon]
MKYYCKRCQHVWIARTNNKPKVCPNCKSVYWDTPKKLHYNWHASHKKLIKV